ncbi:MAG TPA: beta-ketoacyl-ACP synthase II [Actinomycetota bacterium]|nr:beta-ketoacyl-ACP synthase II [Actinomycetota bacterium]
MTSRRVVVTGIGPVTPVGIGVDRFWSSLVEGRSGVGKLEAFDASSHASRIAAEVHDFVPEHYMEPAEVRRMERFAQMAVAAAKLALTDAALTIEDPARVGCVIGTGIGGIGSFEKQTAVLAARGPSRVPPHLVALMIPNMAAGQVAMRLGITGPNDCTVTACAASGHAIARAVDWIRAGRADAVLAGGAESAITPLTVAGFCSARALSTRNDDPEAASRPFDAGRDGFVIGEGATVLVLEDRDHAVARGARIYAEVAGYGLSADAYHETAPEPGGTGGAAAMRGALIDADVNADGIAYVNAHGTSTQLGDIAETKAIKTAFGEHASRLAISSTKSMHGHLLGATGATEAAATALALANQIAPPTINLSNPDPECDLDYIPNVARPMRIDAALTNSFGFGGQNVSIVMKRW